MKPEPKPKSAAALPFKPVAEELAFLRKSFKELISAYSTQVEADIAQLQIILAALFGLRDGPRAERFHAAAKRAPALPWAGQAA